MILPPSHAGFLIAIDGIDGGGKTTLARALQAELSKRGTEVVLSKEPTNGQFGLLLRASAATGRLPVEEELALLHRDRLDHVSSLIEPALHRDAVVILDRYYFSTVAYQGAAGADSKAIIATSEAIAPRPHVTLILDLPVDVALGRIDSRGDEANHFERRETLLHCRDLFLQAAAATEDAHVVDARESISEVFTRCLGLVALAYARVQHQRYGFTEVAAERVSRLLALV